MNLDEMLKAPIGRAIKSLHLINSFNQVRNDLDVYLYEVYLYGIGLREDWPEQKDYGIDDNKEINRT